MADSTTPPGLAFAELVPLRLKSGRSLLRISSLKAALLSGTCQHREVGRCAEGRCPRGSGPAFWIRKGFVRLGLTSRMTRPIIAPFL